MRVTGRRVEGSERTKSGRKTTGKIVKYFYAYECFKCRQRHALFQAAMRAPAPRTLDFTAEKLRLAFCRCDKKRGRRRRRRRKRKERKRYVKSTWVSIWKGKAAVECRTSLSFFLLFFFLFYGCVVTKRSFNSSRNAYFWTVRKWILVFASKLKSKTDIIL